MSIAFLSQRQPFTLNRLLLVVETIFIGFGMTRQQFEPNLYPLDARV